MLGHNRVLHQGVATNQHRLKMWCQFQSLCAAAFLAVVVFFAIGAEAEYKRWGSQAGVV